MGWLCASGALAQEAPPSEPAAGEAPERAAAQEGVRLQLGAQLAYGFGEYVEGLEGLGVRLQGLLRFNDYFATGVEVGLFFGAGSRTGVDELSISQVLPVFTVPVRVGLDRGVFRPALVLGPVAMANEGRDGLGFFAGLELGIAPGRIPVVFDARYYKRLSDSSVNYPVSVSLGLGTRF